jgi:prophage maintenance system killer protein
VSAMNELAEAYLKCHEIVREIIREDTGHYPRNYKRLEKGKIDKFFRNVPYKSKSVLAFGAETMSGLIVAHALPNANHRSTILFTALFFEMCGVRFPCYDTRKKRDQWIRDCNRYIADSKRILYARKRDPRYRGKHLELTRMWLENIIGGQSKSSGMMSRKSLTTLRKRSSSWDLSSVIVKK